MADVLLYMFNPQL